MFLLLMPVFERKKSKITNMTKFPSVFTLHAKFGGMRLAIVPKNLGW